MANRNTIEYFVDAVDMETLPIGLMSPAFPMKNARRLYMQIVPVSGTHNTHSFGLEVSADGIGWSGCELLDIVGAGCIEGETAAPFVRIVSKAQEPGPSVINFRLIAR